MAKLFDDAGLITMTAFISPYRKDRDNNRHLLEEGEFIEVFMKVSLPEAEKRDPKGLYKKARAGEIKEFTGIDAPYEEPLDPEMVIDTDALDLQKSKDMVIRFLEEKNIIKKGQRITVKIKKEVKETLPPLSYYCNSSDCR